MVRFTGGLLLFSAFAFAAPTEHTQSPLAPSQRYPLSQVKEPTPARKPQGRFLHITDVHPDPFYKASSNTNDDHACHSGSGAAGLFGTPMSDCDSPLSLVNATFQWIKENLKDEIDFVIWTGDSARHDNDGNIPRSEKQVLDQNKMLVRKFAEVFGKDDKLNDPDPTNEFVVPIIPTFGNNDILPHNIFEPGPNVWTKKYSTIWNRFIPEEQHHSFERGGWFFVEVIKNKLAVFSLNTIYFFDSNSAVDGCDAKSEPGYEHMEWLRVQLQLLRERGMKAIITGHVPPARTDRRQWWDETCWQKYTLWMRQYRDVVVGSVYGHMNIDHFTFQDARDVQYNFLTSEETTIKKHERKAEKNIEKSDKRINVNTKPVQYLKELREFWSELPAPPAGLSYAELSFEQDEDESGKKKSKKRKKREKFLEDIGGEWAERFSLSLVSPSVVPNYYPTLRVIEYNITGLEGDSPAIWHSPELLSEADDEITILDTQDVKALSPMTSSSEPAHDLKIKTRHKKNTPKKPNFKVPYPPSKTSPPGPAYSPQTFTFLSYVQYFANLTTINEKATTNDYSAFKYEMEYDTKTDKRYGLKDLTMRQYLDLAKRMSRKTLQETGEEEDVDRAGEVQAVKTTNKVWHAFVTRAFVMTKPDEQLDDKFD